MNYYKEIKDILINNEINKKVKDYSKNKVELESYYNVGKLLFDAGKHYGERVIKEYSIKLTKELGKGYGLRNLYNMRLFYIFLNDRLILQPMVAKLNWTSICIIMNIKDINKQKYYIDLMVNNTITKRELQERIKNKEYERLPEETKLKLKEKKDLNITDKIKNPIVIKNNNVDINNIREKVLQRIILEDIENFLNQLGSGYAFIGSEYKIKIGNNYNYIDLLLFNIGYNCYVVVELKITPLKKEHIGQIDIYMNYIDKTLKKVNQDKTIGLIICKKNDEYIIEYSSDNRIIAREYELC